MAEEPQAPTHADVGDALGSRRFGSVPGLVAIFAAGVLAMVSLALVNFLIGADWVLLKVGEESNIPTWFSSVQLFAVGAVLAPLAYRDLDRRRPATWALVIVPGLFVLLSLDEIAMFHERIGIWLQETPGIGTGLRTTPWMLVVVPFVGVLSAVAAYMFWPYLRGRRKALGLAVAGFLLFGLSAVGVESVANFAIEGSAIHKLLGFIEETGEMIAVNLILWSVVLVVRGEGIRLEIGRRSATSLRPQQ